MALLSFPTQLGLERMNIDILIFSGFYFICIQWSNPKGSKPWSSKLTTAIMAFVVSGVKIYPELGIICWLWYERLLKKREIDRWIAVGAIGGLISAIPWMLSGEKFALPPVSLTSHGLIAGRNGEEFGLLLTALSICVMCTAYAAHNKTVQLQQTEIVKRSYGRITANLISPRWAFAKLGLVTWAISYVVTTSFDYRLVFVLPILIVIGDDLNGTVIAKNTGDKSVMRIALISAFLYMWIPLSYMLSEKLGSLGPGPEAWTSFTISDYIRFTSALLSRILDAAGLPFFLGAVTSFIISRDWMSKQFRLTLHDPA